MAKQKKVKRKEEEQKKKTPNSHDVFFKNTFSYPEVARTYIEKFLDPKLVQHIDLDSLELENASFVTPELEEYFSDLVWNVKYKATKIKVSILFEHKSYVVSHPHLQLLRYILEHIEAQLKAKESLNVVIPIVIYHGENEWRVRHFWEYFEGVEEVLMKYIPNFNYHLTNLADYTDAELIEMGIGKLTNVFLAMAHVRNVEYIINNFSTIFVYIENEIKDERFLNFFQTIFVYLYQNTDITSEQLEKIVTTINQPLKDATMTTYDMLIQKGIEEGIQKGKEEVVINLIKTFPDWDDDKIANLSATHITFVKAIRQKIS